MDDLWNSLTSWFNDKLNAVKEWFITFADDIPQPEWWDEAYNKVHLLTQGSLGFYADLLHLDYGITIVLSAYALRFAVRRIPIIG